MSYEIYWLLIYYNKKLREQWIVSSTLTYLEAVKNTFVVIKLVLYATALYKTVGMLLVL